eukprot:CAMPEP_0206217368 /NCGR_PEP_ID=MMETSP0047_2-20121206/3238_1 /ASSEMBLY_ACC=CAM_ASM_000192 /TAXON_ID=195065 /ORGANISM="Chroomonas mesostigmatica_cf, Strain CCMP1168" /LENGTH=260 /DNA_ID=CAMNT_0053639819 /DNA_START=758 /DNA_END=1537 /DNA_ORIENTATION=-
MPFSATSRFSGASISTSAISSLTAVLVIPGSLYRSPASSAKNLERVSPVSSLSSRAADSLISSPSASRPAGASTQNLSVAGRNCVMSMISSGLPLDLRIGSTATAHRDGMLGRSTASHPLVSPASSSYSMCTSSSHLVPPTTSLEVILGRPLASAMATGEAPGDLRAAQSPLLDKGPSDERALRAAEEGRAGEETNSAWAGDAASEEDTLSTERRAAIRGAASIGSPAAAQAPSPSALQLSGALELTQRGRTLLGGAWAA